METSFGAMSAIVFRRPQNMKKIWSPPLSATIMTKPIPDFFLKKKSVKKIEKKICYNFFVF